LIHLIALARTIRILTASRENRDGLVPSGLPVRRGFVVLQRKADHEEIGDR